jgi:ABC-type Fe3+-siderophore transport system permease subunit
MKKESLLEKAKKVGRKNNTTQNITDEHVELALAWARGDVSYSQIKKVLGLTVPSTIYSFLAFSLRKHIETK